jgi:hypothetical protein
LTTRPRKSSSALSSSSAREYPSQYFGFTCTSKAAKGWLTYRIGRDVDLVKVRRVPATVVAPPPPAADCSSAETHWKSAESIGTLAAYNDHLARFPNCVFSTLAAARIEALKK